MSAGKKARPDAAKKARLHPALLRPTWMQQPYWVDPPSGWRYGFPRLYDPEKDGNITEWLIANGYPKTLAEKDLHCTFTEHKAADKGTKP